MNNLNEAWQNASQEIYQATQGQEAGGDPQAPGAEAGAEAESGSASDVSDVEYEEVDDKK